MKWISEWVSATKTRLLVAKRRRHWEKIWGRTDVVPLWADRDVSPEIVQAIEAGWLPKEGPVLDIGCGKGEIAVWFARRGYQVLGFDIAEAAIQRARQAYPNELGLKLTVLDACHEPPPNDQYTILIDRGCFHQIPSALVPPFVRNIASVSAPGARMMLFMKAFRAGQPAGDAAETEKLVEWVGEAFSGHFVIERYALTYLDREFGRNPATAMPGLVFYMNAC